MSYRQTVEPHHRQMYSDNVKMVAQQLKNHLEGAVTVLPAKGEAQSLADLVGAIEPSEAEDYSRTNPQNVPSRSRRWLVRPNAIESGQLITKAEQWDQAMDETSILFNSHIKAVLRGWQDRVLGVKKNGDGTYSVSGGGILGQSNSGKNPGTTSDLPSGNYIGVGVGNAGTPTGLNLSKIRAATEAMEIADFGLEEDYGVYGLLTPKQKTDLIDLAIATGANLNPFEVENIKEGKPGRLLGVNWLFSNRVPVDENGYRLNPIWNKENIVAGEWQSIQGDIWNDTSAKNQPQIMVDAVVAAGRIEDGGVRVIRNNEA